LRTLHFVIADGQASILTGCKRKFASTG
jgi:hypothetical protein